MIRYWAIYTITGNGYGDITPVTQTEVYLASVCMILGALLWASVLGSILEAMTLNGERQRESQMKLDKLQGLVEAYNVPRSVERSDQ